MLPRVLFRSVVTTEKFILKRFYSPSLNLSDPSIVRYLSSLMLEHEKLMSQLKREPNEVRRLQEIKPIIKALEQRMTLYENIEDLKELNKMQKDQQIRSMIKQEAEIYLKRIREVDGELQAILLEPHLSEGGVLVEVLAGAGGQEAMLFAKELCEIYMSYAKYKGWQADVASLEESDLGGYRKVSILVSGYGAPDLMKMEAGVHRVQRIPVTEKGGRIHTSTVSVAVLPRPAEIDLDIPDRDIYIETKRASGAGGQHVNTTDSAVRVTHIPTGSIVECQEGRSQIKNKQIAIQKLRSMLLQKLYKNLTSEINSERKAQIGSGNRNEKIRTYNYPQDRVTEHREGGGSQYSLKVFMEGGEQLEKLQENLLRHQRYKKLMREIKEFPKDNKLES